MTRYIASLIVYIMCAIAIIGCASAQTPGQQFRSIMADIDKECRKDHLGPYQTSPPGNGVRDSSCDILFLKPYDPLATPEGRFAHSIQLPPPYDQPKEVYKPGMTSAEYFRALCEAEAGEFVFKTITDVEGVYEMRPAQAPGDYELMHLYANEGPTGRQIGDFGDAIGEALVQPYTGRYQFIEQKNTSHADSGRYLRSFRDASANPGKTLSTRDAAGNWKQVPNVLATKAVDTLNSKYGYTWRGVSRTNDRELGIAGGEVILINLETKEVLGLRRIFRRTGLMGGRTNVWWLTAQNCSSELAMPASAFLYKVLQPAERD
ncbi:MAG: hypothetical protein ABI619_06210 [Betaproteobacteria bacterium]